MLHAEPVLNVLVTVVAKVSEGSLHWAHAAQLVAPTVAVTTRISRNRFMIALLSFW
jgi:hypothetical protein